MMIHNLRNQKCPYGISCFHQLLLSITGHSTNDNKTIRMAGFKMFPVLKSFPQTSKRSSHKMKTYYSPKEMKCSVHEASHFRCIHVYHTCFSCTPVYAPNVLLQHCSECRAKPTWPLAAVGRATGQPSFGCSCEKSSHTAYRSCVCVKVCDRESMHAIYAMTSLTLQTY